MSLCEFVLPFADFEGDEFCSVNRNSYESFTNDFYQEFTSDIGDYCETIFSPSSCEDSLEYEEIEGSTENSSTKIDDKTATNEILPLFDHSVLSRVYSCDQTKINLEMNSFKIRLSQYLLMIGECRLYSHWNSLVQVVYSLMISARDIGAIDICSKASRLIQTLNCSSPTFDENAPISSLIDDIEGACHNLVLLI